MSPLALLVGLLCCLRPAPLKPPPALLAEVHLEKRAEHPQCALFLPDGKTIVFAGGGPLGPGEILFWDVETRKPVKAFREHKYAICSIALSPDGKRIATGGGFGEVKVWDTDGKVLASLDARVDYARGIGFSPDGKWLAHSGGPLTVRDTEKYELHPLFKKGMDFGPTFSFAPDGKTIMGSYGPDIRFYTLPDWKRSDFRSKIPRQRLWDMQHAPDGKSVAINTYISRDESTKEDIRSIEVWSISGATMGNKRFEVNGGYRGYCFTADSKFLIVGESHDEAGHPEVRIRVFDTATGKQAMSWFVSHKPAHIYHLALSPDGKLLVSCDDKSGKVWDFEKLMGKYWVDGKKK